MAKSWRFGAKFGNEMRFWWHVIKTESCIRAPVLLNLLNSLGKTDKMLGKASHLFFFPQLVS